MEEPDAGERTAFVAGVKPFYISRAPISNLQYECYNPGHVRDPGSPHDDWPATGVSFADASGYCAWYAGVSRKAMRLPTEIDWEYACRGGTSGRCFYGEREAADDYAWHAENSGGRLERTETKKANPFGLYGMLGGVWEWTGSLHLPYPAHAGDGRDDPRAPGPRVLRGGSYRTPPRSLGCGVRRAEEPEARADDFGFRIARGL